MTPLNDEKLAALRAALLEPDLSGTKYRLVSQIGAGGMGTVWEAEDGELGRTVAVKTLDDGDRDSPLGQRLLQEARVLARLEHPGLVPVHDVGTLPDGRPYYVMKIVRGSRLDEHVSAVSSLSERLRLFYRLCEPVAFAHARGVLHRDLKPQNVMAGPFGEVLVMDWGLAKVLGEKEVRAAGQNPGAAGLTGAGVVLGTPGFMAPEQSAGDPGAIDPRSDVYSLGAILEFLRNEPGLSDRGNRRLSAIVAKAMAPLPDERYPDVPSLMADVAAYLEGASISAYRERPWERLLRLARRHQTALVLLLAYLVARAFVFFVYRR